MDREINQLCPHLVVEEALYVSADRQTVRPLRPISSSNSLQLMLNHEIVVPFEGVQTAATVRGTRRGPFTFGSGSVINLIVNQGAVQTLTLPIANKMAPIQVAALLNQQLTGAFFSVVNDSLALTTSEKGPSVSLFLRSDSTAAAVFGINVNREFRGQQVVPGWTLVSDPTTLSDRPTRLVVFDTPLNSGSDMIELSYATIREECRRCGGTGFENDWRFDVGGTQILIGNEDLLVQEVQKILYTQIGSNPFHPKYGTGILDSIGKKIASGGFTQNLILADVTAAFSRWQGIKRAQEDVVGQPVTDREFPFRLLSVNIQQSAADPTVIFLDITIQNRSNEPIQLTRGLKIPQALQVSTSPIRSITAG